MSRKAAGTPRKQGYSVGVTVAVRDDADANVFFHNGLRQNVLFLFQLFKASPDCARTVLVNISKSDVPSLDAFGISKQEVVRIDAVKDDLDYLIVAGGEIEAGLLRAMRARGCKVICYKGGNGGVISMESIIENPPAAVAEPYRDWDCYDQVWITPQHMHTYAGWCRTVYRCPVHQIQQVWNPTFARLAPMPEGLTFGFKVPAGEPWRLGVLDPNITVMKTSHMPVLVCEAAYRRRPELIQHLYVTNALKLKENEHFKRFANALSVTKDGKLTVEDRFVSWSFITSYCDAIVTHHWENGLNYLYYEVLYGNYPLIHNSRFLRDYGYFYEDFDAQSGAQALLTAFETHAGGLEAYAKQNQALFADLDPQGASAIAAHEKLLLG